MSSKPNGSPPPYNNDDAYHAPPDLYDAGPPQTAYSYYPDDEIQHFYRWTSPPGIIKIIAVVIIIMCVAIFACVASTLAWDSNMGLMGFGGLSGGYGYGGSSYGGTSYGGGYGGGYNSFGGAGYGPGNAYGYGNLGGNYIDPRKGKGFMIAMAAIIFIAVLAIFILVVSRQYACRTRKFYLIFIIGCAILAFFMFIATIVYLVAVNPMAQSSGSVYSSQIMGLCAQYQTPQPTDIFINQYLYHYCVVEPQEAIAIVLGFLVTAGLIIMLVFAVKTRLAIGRYGKEQILWDKVKVINEEDAPQDVEEWVNNVSSSPPHLLAEYPEKSGSRNYLDDHSMDYGKPPYSYNPDLANQDTLPHTLGPYSSSSSSLGKPGKKPNGRPSRTSGYDTAESGDELDDDEFDSEFPPITTEQQRQDYKRQFDKDHQEYKNLQAEMDNVSKNLAEVDQDLDNLEEGSPQFLDAMDEYNRLKEIKRSSDYQTKKRRCKYLKGKLSHIKKMVSDFDHRD